MSIGARIGLAAAVACGQFETIRPNSEPVRFQIQSWLDLILK